MRREALIAKRKSSGVASRPVLEHRRLRHPVEGVVDLDRGQALRVAGQHGVGLDVLGIEAALPLLEGIAARTRQQSCSHGPNPPVTRHGKAQRIFRQAPLRSHPRAAAGRAVEGGSGPLLFVVQQHSARRAALRLPARVRRRAEVLGGAEGAVARSGRQAPRRATRGPSVRLRLVRGRDPARPVRRGRGDRLGLRRLLAGRRRHLVPRPRRGRAPACAKASRRASSASCCAARS